MKKVKFLLLATILTFGLYSCQDEKELLVEQPKQDAEFRLTRHRFASVDEMYAAMSEIRQRKHNKRARRTKANWIKPVDKADTVPDLELPITDIDEDYMGDGIIKYEYTNISKEKLINGDDITYYEACGYDTLVPDTTFARVLNIKGEVQVGDTVYKISPKGTYHFHASLEPYFAENYAQYEQLDGMQVSDKTYLIDKAGIYRYDTFKQDEPDYAEADNMPDDIIEESIKFPIPDMENKNFYSEVNWSKFPVYNADHKTIMGKIWQSFWGGGKTRYYKFAKKRRTRAKLYCYNYGIKMSIGAEVELQKKNWIGWSGTNADKLTLNWHHIMISYPYPKGAPKVPYAPGFATLYNVKDYIPALEKNARIVSVFGMDTDDNELRPYSKTTTQELQNFISKKLGCSVPWGNAYMIYAKKKIYMIIIDGHVGTRNAEKIVKTFEEDWGALIQFDLMAMESGWEDFGKAIWNRLINSPKLVGGQIRAGACLGDTWGAMTIEKK